MTIKTATPIDRHVGARIRMQRTMCGFSQTELGQAVGISFQQVQKYGMAPTASEPADCTKLRTPWRSHQNPFSRK